MSFSDTETVLWDVITQGQLRVLPGGSEGQWRSTTFSPDGNVLAVADADAIRLWHVNDGELAGELEPGTRPVYSPDGKWLAAVTEWNTVNVWSSDARSRQSDADPPRAILPGHADRVTGLVFSGDGSVLVSAGDHRDRTTRVWDTQSWTEVASFDGYPSWRALATSVDGSMVAVGFYDTLTVWDVEAGIEAGTMSLGDSYASAVAFDPATGMLVVATSGPELGVLLWNVATWQQVHAFGDHTTGVEDIAMSPDGRFMATAARHGDTDVRLWDMESRRLLRRLDGAGPVSFGPNSELLTYTGADGLRLVDLNTGELAGVVVTVPATALALSPDSQLIASVTVRWNDVMLRFWDLESRRQRGEVRRPASNVAVSSDWRWLAYGMLDGTISIQEFGGDPSVSVDARGKQLATLGELKRTALHPNYPNPFNPETWIPFTLAEPTDVVIRIYGLSGQLVRTLDVGRRRAGRYTDRGSAARWDGTNEVGERVSSGSYVYELQAGEKRDARRMAILK